jgi:uncharacterized membrane protein
MDDFIIARVIHVVSVLFWIGGVAFVTLVVMPSVRTGNLPEERLSAFHRIEGRFAPQARIWVLLAGASGFWMTWRGQMWDRFTIPPSGGCMRWSLSGSSSRLCCSSSNLCSCTGI